MKDYDLKKWDKVKFKDWTVSEYIKTDWMYSKWRTYDEKWILVNDCDTFHLWDTELEKKWEYFFIKKLWLK